MSSLRISVASKQYVPVSVLAKIAGVVTDPTADTVQMAFPLKGVDPVSGDWKAADWETDATVTPHVYVARCLVGPGGVVQLAIGRYDPWVKVTDNPEIPVLQAPFVLEIY